jgi:GDSL-like Lipase/Acylhydrolase family
MLPRISLASLTAISAFASETFLRASDPRIVASGRRYTDSSSGAATFDWEAVSFRVNVSGATYLKAVVSVPAGSRSKFVIDEPWSTSAESNGAKDSDGFVLGDLMWADAATAGANGTTTLYAAGLDPSKQYELRLFHDLEPMFHGAECYGPGNATFIGFASDGAFSAARKKTRLLEWVGDSLTAGFGSRGSTPPCAATQYSSSNFHSYSRLSCDALDAECSVIAVSGKGMFANCCDDLEKLPSYFLQTMGNEAYSKSWDFSFIPDALVINAGTNDEGKNNGTKAWSDAFEATFVAFVQDALSARYKRQMPVLLVQGPALDDRLYASLQRILATLIAAGVDAHYVSAVVDAPADGCAGHPGNKNHVLMADAFTAAASAILGWK